MKPLFVAALVCGLVPFAASSARAQDASLAPHAAPPAQQQAPVAPVAPTAAESPSFEVAGAYAFATAPTQDVGAAFMALQNSGAVDAVLNGASSPVSEKVELHTHLMEDGVMQMRAVDQFVVPAGGTLVMAPRSHHLMLIGLKAPLAIGQTFPIVLHFANAPSIEAVYRVVAPGQAAPQHGKGQ